MLIHVGVGEATVVVGLGILGVDPDGFIVVLDCPLVLIHVGVGEATVVVGVGVLGVDPDGFIVVLDCPLVLAESAVGDTTVVVSIGIRRINTQCLVKFGDSLDQLPLFRQRVGYLHMLLCFRTRSRRAGRSGENRCCH